MIKVPSLILADRFQGQSVDWAGGNGSTETNVAYPVDLADKFKTYARFDGNGKIDITENQNFNFGHEDNFTISTWIELKETSPLELIVARQLSGEGYRIAREGNTVEFSFSGIKTTTTCNFNEWVQITGVYANYVMKLYKNGVLIDSLDMTGTNLPYQQDTPLIIGEYTSGRFNFNGKIADLQIFNKALPESDIKRVMAGLKPISI